MARAKVFISYSHKDERWRERLVKHLGVLQREGLLDLWDDRRLAAGDDFLHQIQAHMLLARVAVLLISADFLTSEFIRTEEVPRLFDQHVKEGMTIYPLLVRDCAWQEVPWLARMQLRPPDAKPVNRRGKADEILANVAREIASMVRGGPIPSADGRTSNDATQRPSPSPALGSVVGAAVAQTLSTVVVDLMRLFYVVASDAAYKANASRYAAFLGIADRHFADLRGTLAQFATALDAASHQRLVTLQRRLSWMQDQLRVGPSARKRTDAYRMAMRESAVSVEEFCLRIAPEVYSQEAERVDRIMAEFHTPQTSEPWSLSADEAFHLRLTIQSRFLAERRDAGEATLFTIGDDMDQRFGIGYFVIDHRLLTSAALTDG